MCDVSDSFSDFGFILSLVWIMGRAEHVDPMKSGTLKGSDNDFYMDHMITMTF